MSKSMKRMVSDVFAVEKKEISSPENRTCNTCIAGYARSLTEDYLCARAQVVVEPGKNRVNCPKWEAVDA